MILKLANHELRGAAADAFCCKDPEILVDGPAGTGKTTSLLYKALAIIEKYPGARVLLVRKTRASMTQSILTSLEDKILGHGHPLIGNVDKANRQSYRHPNGSTIVIGGLDNVDRIMSTDYDVVIVFEGTEVSESDMETLTTRLRNHVVPYQQIIIDCNPGHSKHWLKLRADSGRMTRFQSRHEDNPLLYDGTGWTEFGERYLATLGRLGGARRLRLAQGIWASSEGVVYENWNAAVHMLPARIHLPASWRRIVSIDFGYTNPFVAQLWALDHDGRMYREREIYMSRRTVQQHIPVLRQMVGDYTIEAWVADHDAEDRATLQQSGIYTIRAKKDVKPGIDAVATRLAIAGDGRPRMFFLPDAVMEVDQLMLDEGKPVCTEQEFDGYSWPPSVDGKPNKEQPIKIDDHGMDTTRYAVMYFEHMGR